MFGTHEMSWNEDRCTGCGVSKEDILDDLVSQDCPAHDERNMRVIVIGFILFFVICALVFR